MLGGESPQSIGLIGAYAGEGCSAAGDGFIGVTEATGLDRSAACEVPVVEVEDDGPAALLG